MLPHRSIPLRKSGKSGAKFAAEHIHHRPPPPSTNGCMPKDSVPRSQHSSISSSNVHLSSATNMTSSQNKASRARFLMTNNLPTRISRQSIFGIEHYTYPHLPSLGHATCTPLPLICPESLKQADGRQQFPHIVRLNNPTSHPSPRTMARSSCFASLLQRNAATVRPTNVPYTERKDLQWTPIG
jgi:hypothetical protein